jgi:hypothetical protein
VNPRHWIIRHLTPRVWRLWPARRQAALMEFSAIERDSGQQLRQCMDLTEDPALRGYLFQHVLEETFHGELFEDLARSGAEKHPVRPVLPREELITPDSPPDEITAFFSSVHVGEAAVNADFRVYAQAVSDPATRGIFRVAGEDEGRHEADTDRVLVQLCGSPADARSEARQAWRRRWWTLYVDAMHRVGLVPLTLLLGGTYLLLGWLAVPSLRRRLVLGAGDQLGLLQDQLDEFSRELQ